MFKLNRNEAIENDQRGGGFINEAGKYVVTIESAIWYIGQSQNGRSENIILNVVTDSKKKGRFYINTSYKDGMKNEGGLQTVSAMLACLRMRESGDPTPAPISEYNHDTKKEETVVRDCFTTLHGKKLGIVVQMIHNKEREHPNATIYTVFEAGTELIASEILNGVQQPGKLAKIVEYITSRPLIDKRESQSGRQAPPPQRREQLQAAPIEDIDDDIPF